MTWRSRPCGCAAVRTPKEWHSSCPEPPAVGSQSTARLWLAVILTRKHEEPTHDAL